MKMMKKIVFILIFGIIIHNDVLYAQKNGNDSLYRDLCLILVHQKIISKEYMLEFKTDYSKLIYICDILERHLFPPSKPDFSKPFGIYFFDFIGLEIEEFSFVMIQYNGNYKIFNRFRFDVIINEIIRIREEDSQIIDNKLLIQYIKAITNFKNQRVGLGIPFGSALLIIDFL